MSRKRTCAWPDCGTILNTYNKNKYCTFHFLKHVDRELEGRKSKEPAPPGVKPGWYQLTVWKEKVADLKFAVENLRYGTYVVGKKWDAKKKATVHAIFTRTYSHIRNKLPQNIMKGEILKIVFGKK